MALSMERLPRWGGVSEERRGVWWAVCNQLLEGRHKSSVEIAEHEAELEAQMRALRESDPDLCVTVTGDGLSLMHMAARHARTEGSVLMRHRTRVGDAVLMLLAFNPNMMRDMYAVFEEHCTDDDLRAANNNGWTVLFRMAVTFIEDAETEEQEENIASVMCEVVQRLGAGALLAETTKEYMCRNTKYPAGSTPRSLLRGAGGKGRTLLWRLEETTAHPEDSAARATVGEALGSALALAQSAGAPSPAGT